MDNCCRPQGTSPWWTDGRSYPPRQASLYG